MCRTPSFGCYKRRGLEFAQCRPLPPAGQACADTTDWRCPGWEACSASGRECTSSRCCDDENHACFKRPYAHYAQCRPFLERIECVDTDEWLCPGSEGRSVGLGSWETCSSQWQKCLESGW